MHLRNLAPFFLILLFPVNGFSQISYPDRSLNTLNSDEIWAKTLKGNHFNEFWSFHFFLDHGITAHATFSAANFGSLKSPVTGLQLSVRGLDHTVYQLSREYDLDHLIQNKESAEFRLRQEREIFFKGTLPGHLRVRIHTTKEGVEYDLDLQIHSSNEGIKLGDGLYRVGDHDVGFLTHIPYADVTGTIRINQSVKEVTGTAYMDHVYQFQTTTRLIESGYRFVRHRDPDHWDLLFVMIPDHDYPDQVIGQRIRMHGGETTFSFVEKIEIKNMSSTFGNNLTGELLLQLSDGKTVTLQRTVDEERFSVLGELNRFARAAARRFLGGEVIHFRGLAHLTEEGEEWKEGHYNFFIVR